MSPALWLSCFSVGFSVPFEHKALHNFQSWGLSWGGTWPSILGSSNLQFSRYATTKLPADFSVPQQSLYAWDNTNYLSMPRFGKYPQRESICRSSLHFLEFSHLWKISHSFLNCFCISTMTLYRWFLSFIWQLFPLGWSVGLLQTSPSY